MIQWLVRRRRGACILYSIQLHCFMDDTAHGRHQWISQPLELFSFLSAHGKDAAAAAAHKSHGLETWLPFFALSIFHLF
jgi:hypothetical protein